MAAPKVAKQVQNHRPMILVVQAGTGKKRFVPLAQDEK